jgi:lipopolysaccharide assembly outer membrane protein LptD (OstA)
LRSKIFIFLLLFGTLGLISQSDVFQNNSHSAERSKRTVQADTTHTDIAKVPRPQVGNKKKLANLKESADSASTDTISADSIKKSKSMLDEPVTYTAKDSMTYDAATGLAHLYGEAQVNYQNLQLNSDEIVMCMDSSIVHAYGRPDSTGTIVGKPVFKQGSDEYKSDQMDYNFKTHKGFINQVKTKEGDGFLTSESSKRNSAGELFVEHGRYTTCDAEHPHFYIALSRAKVRPGKDVVFGPAYLVVEDVPLPLAVPYGFFPFSKRYSSGFIMPTYGDETVRGFYLRDGGYYFAINDNIDLKLTGEIYTKGSWGLNAQSNYNKRYRYSGNFYLSYLLTKEGEKNMPDYSVTKSFKIQWTHRQDAKANPNQSISASVNFASESYEKKNLTSMYNPTSYTQSTRTSSVSYSRSFSDIGLTLSGTFNLSQNMRDSSIALTMPTLNIALNRFYPFKRKKMAGAERWYEKIAMSYTGTLSNSITTKENKLFHSNLIKDWRNGMQHTIPLSASFSILNYINVTPSFNFTDRMYTYKVNRSWDEANQIEQKDTIYGFNNVYNYNMSVSINTKLYGFYVPLRKLFGDKIQAIRHVFTPSLSFSYAPDFGTSHYGYWDSYVKTDSKGNVSTVSYSPYNGSLYGVPGKGKTGMMTMDVSNNLEMKIKSEKDSTGYRKISLIDELGASMSYNFASTTHPLSDLSMRLRLKLTKSYTFSLNALFATYAYELDKDGNVYVGNRTEYSHGRFGRFQGMSQNLSYTFSNNTLKKLKKLFGHGDDEDEKQKAQNAANNQDNGTDTNVDPDLLASRNSAQSDKKKESNIDEDGYLKFSLPWSFSVSYGVTMRENTSAKINTKRMRYPYKLTHTMNFSGNLRISEGWNINFSSGYDFNYHKISMTTASLNRDLHCCSMSASIVLSPYTSYNFTFSANASVLADVLKWKKQSSYSSNIEWY